MRKRPKILVVREVTEQLITVESVVQEILFELQDFDDQVRSIRSNSLDSEAVLQAIEVNRESSIRRVSGELVVWFITFTTLAKASGTAEFHLTLPKLLICLYIII